MIETARTAAVYRATVLENPYIPHIPHPRQQDALSLWSEFDVGYGGAAGGGKTDWLIDEALAWVDEPKYSALIIRRTLAELKKADGVIPRVREWLAGSGAVENRTEHKWQWPNGATLEFGYLEHEGDEYNYKGARYDFVGVEQAEDFPHENQILFMVSRLRRAKGSRIPPRLRMTFNPGGVGHEWITRRYIPDEYDDLRDRPVWIKSYKDERGKVKKSHFVFATLEDNPSIDRAEYEEALWWLPPHTRRMLLDGDWKAGIAGKYFKLEWFRYVDLMPTVARWVRYWDLGASDDSDSAYTVGVRIGLTTSPISPESEQGRDVVIGHVVRGRWTAGTRDQVIRDTAGMDPPGTVQYFEQEPGSGGKAQIVHLRSDLRGFTVKARVKRVKKEVDWGPLASWAESRGVYLVRGDWNRPLTDELTSLPKATYKDQADAAAGGFQVLGVKRPRPKVRVHVPRALRL